LLPLPLAPSFFGAALKNSPIIVIASTLNAVASAMAARTH
jgi:hypothetical protein